ncbi:MAG: hypothetical protein K6T83_08500 [Alicyclobacillus sp.]|nr:hypothetical protein [Alicyclobacillus sp.]
MFYDPDRTRKPLKPRTNVENRISPAVSHAQIVTPIGNALRLPLLETFKMGCRRKPSRWQHQRLQDGLPQITFGERMVSYL